MADIQIKLLGQLSVTNEDVHTDRFETQKVGGVLIYLALSLGVATSREILVDTFWPDSGKRKGQGSLRHALSSLRRVLEPPGIYYNSVLVADRYTVRLNPDAITIDVARFEQFIEQAERSESPEHRQAMLEQAIALYTGELLPGYYEKFIIAKQKQLMYTFKSALETLVAEAVRQKGWLKAEEYARKILALEMASEETYLTAIRLSDETGHPEEALKLYLDIEQMYREKLDDEPSTRLAQLAEEIRTKVTAAQYRRLSHRNHRAAAEATTNAKPRIQRDEHETLQHSMRRAGVPILPTRLFGREAEIEALLARLLPTETPPAPLITLTGTAGFGKTHLAKQVGVQLEVAYHGAVFYVGLEEITQAELILPTIATHLLPDGTIVMDPLREIRTFFANHPALLILDNLEQLITDTEGDANDVRDGVDTIQQLHDQLPSVALLLTSREALALPSETLYPLSFLPLPPEGIEASLQDMRENPCVKLYLDRARKKKSDFQLTEHHAPALAELCRRLDGIPLGIEIVASSVETMPPIQMLEAIQKGEVPKNRSRGGPLRHTSLTAAFDVSFLGLSAQTKRFFARLSVFRGGWTEAAAKDICQEPQAGRYLRNLVDKSLVYADDFDGTTRYRMLPTMRDYAQTKLGGSEEVQQWRGYHAKVFGEFAKQMGEGYLKPDRGQYLLALTQEMENLSAALNWALEAEDRLTSGINLAASIEQYWHITGRYAEGRFLLGALARAGASLSPSPEYGKVLRAAATLASLQGDFVEAQKLAQQSRTVFASVEAEQDVAMVDNILGNIAYDTHQMQECEARHWASIAISKTHENLRRVAQSLNNLGNALLKQRKFEQAQDAYKESLDYLRQTQGNEKLDLPRNNVQGVKQVGRVEYPNQKRSYRCNNDESLPKNSNATPCV